jgi:L-rhamnose isomerase
LTIDRKAPRERLKQSLDVVLAETFDGELCDAVESKLFGIGSESYVVGSHEFYLAYAVRRRLMLCLDAGHFHPTESIADKLSAVLEFLPAVLLHLSRGVRWDSDHVVVQTDETELIAKEIVRGGFLDRVAIGLDFFDASIHRVAAWVIGARATQQSLLRALLEPTRQLRRQELDGDFTGRLALLEHAKSLPWGDVWREFCRQNEVPTGLEWLDEIRQYEQRVTSRRVVPSAAHAIADMAEEGAS